MAASSSQCCRRARAFRGRAARLGPEFKPSGACTEPGYQSLLVFHVRQSDNAATYGLAAVDRRSEHQCIEWIAVVRYCLRNEPLVDGIAADAFEHDAIDRARVGSHVELPLSAVAA
jgi:hypothetical protein